MEYKRRILRFLSTKRACILFILLFGLFMSWFIEPHIWINDEGSYLLMADSYAKTGRIFFDNGLDDRMLPQLILHATINVTGPNGPCLAPIMPPIYPVAVYPFYSVFGAYGLSLANLLSYMAALGLIYFISLRFFKDPVKALGSIVLFAFFTYSTMYSIEIWPHGMSLFFSVASVAAAIAGQSIALAFASGSLAGVSIGIRYTNAIFAAILCIYFFASGGLRRGLGYLAGAVLPTLYIVYSNSQVFGNPLTTGYGIPTDIATQSYRLSNLVIGALLYLVVFEKTRVSPVLFRICPYAKECLSRHGGIVKHMLFIISILAIVAFDFIRIPAINLYAFLVDYTYAAQYELLWKKRAVLQSAPIMILSLCGAALALKDPSKKGMLKLFAALMGSITLFIAGNERGDGSVRAMRYLLEVLPYMSILAAAGIYESIRGAKRGYFQTKEWVLVFMAAISINILSLSGDKAVTGYAYKAPVIMSLTALYAYMRRDREIWRRILVFAIILSLSYTAILNLALVLETSMSRSIWHESTRILDGEIPNDSVILYSDHLDLVPIYPLKVEKDIMIGFLENSNITENRIFLEEYLDKEKYVFVIMGKNKTGSWQSSTLIYEYLSEHVVDFGEGNSIHGIYGVS